ncbi:MAG: amidophosphoribosyltransferase [Deltaproteobacteria bacterium]|nr:amidophosphoribosyltransferase [Deltaproteobacteria bacterium]
MCGFVGLIGVQNASHEVYTALQSIQHRGQDSAGIATKKGNHFRISKDLGLVHQVFSQSELQRLEGTCAVGHVRYPTAGTGSREDTQPFYSRRPGIIIAHNGNIINFEEIKKYLLERSIYLSSRCDVEPVLHVLASAVTVETKSNYNIDDVIKALRITYDIVKGAFSIVGIMNIDGVDTMFLGRDPSAIRPACYGRKGDSWIAASESVCLDVLDFHLEGYVEPGEVIFFTPGREPVHVSIKKKSARHCVFEHIYFARPDSHMDNLSVYHTRLDLGKALAKQWLQKHSSEEIDVVIPVPDTSRPSAIAFSETVGVVHREGFIKNRYSPRTFIMPDQDSRMKALKLKLNPIDTEITGKNVMLIDDSIVRGNTLKRITQVLRTKNPASVHLGIYSPPVVNPCYYGIDMSLKKELIACNFLENLGIISQWPEKGDLEKLENALAEFLGVDSLTFLSRDALFEIFSENHCMACFDGNYPVEITDDYLKIIEQDRNAVRCRVPDNF